MLPVVEFWTTGTPPYAALLTPVNLVGKPNPDLRRRQRAAAGRTGEGRNFFGVSAKTVRRKCFHFFARWTGSRLVRQCRGTSPER